MNALYVPSLSHNLIAPFIIREAGITLNTTPKIQCEDPDETQHALTFDDTFRIPLQLHGIFSFFETSKPTLNQLESEEEIYMLTPQHFNPHDIAYALNEDAMLDWEGNMVEQKDRQQYFLADIEIDEEVPLSSIVSSTEEKYCDSVASSRVTMNNHPDTMLQQMIEQRDLGMMKVSLGSTNAVDGQEYLVPDSDDDSLLSEPIEGGEDPQVRSAEELTNYLLEQFET